MFHQTDGPPEEYSVTWPLVNSAIHRAPPLLILSYTHTHLNTNPLFLSCPPSIPQQARQMAAPQPAVPGKACELKVIPSRFEELPAPPWCGRGGGGGLRPPASQARGHLAGVLWNDERAAANHRYCHHNRHHAERRGSHLFSFSARK